MPLCFSLSATSAILAHVCSMVLVELRHRVPIGFSAVMPVLLKNTPVPAYWFVFFLLSGSSSSAATSRGKMQSSAPESTSARRSMKRCYAPSGRGCGDKEPMCDSGWAAPARLGSGRYDTFTGREEDILRPEESLSRKWYRARRDCAWRVHALSKLARSGLPPLGTQLVQDAGLSH